MQLDAKDVDSGVAAQSHQKKPRSGVVLNQQQAISIFKLKETHGYSSRTAASVALARQYNVSR